MLSETDSQVSGAKLLEACNYDHRLCGVVIASQDGNWQELLRTMGPSQLQRNTAMVVWQIRAALGKDCDLARELTQSEA